MNDVQNNTMLSNILMAQLQQTCDSIFRNKSNHITLSLQFALNDNSVTVWGHTKLYISHQYFRCWLAIALVAILPYANNQWWLRNFLYR